MFDFWEATEEYISLIEQYLPHSVAMQKAWLLWRTFLVEGIEPELYNFMYICMYVCVWYMYVCIPVCIWFIGKCVTLYCIHACIYVHMCCILYIGSPKWIHLTKTESQSIYTALQSSDINEISRALSEQQVTIVTVIEMVTFSYTHR